MNRNYVCLRRHDSEDAVVLTAFPAAGPLHFATTQRCLGQMVFEVHVRRVDHLILSRLSLKRLLRGCVGVHVTLMKLIAQLHLRQPLAIPHPGIAWRHGNGLSDCRPGTSRRTGKPWSGGSSEPFMWVASKTSPKGSMAFSSGMVTPNWLPVLR